LLGNYFNLNTMRTNTTTPASGARAARRSWRLARLGLLLLLGWSVLAWVAARALVVNADLSRADVIVVLGGSATYLERTHLAAELFRAGRAPRIILTNDGEQGGWSSAQQRNPFYFERAQEELRRAGVPADSIEVLPQLVSSTYEEAVLLRQWTKAQRLQSILVVTSAYHSRRALWTLRRVFQDSGLAIGLVTPPHGAQTPAPATWWLHPSGWRLVAVEYVKMIYYRICY
jgi:uncharacterized SAM-binding protein YcdF (DUF218 family)